MVSRDGVEEEGSLQAEPNREWVWRSKDTGQAKKGEWCCRLSWGKVILQPFLFFYEQGMSGKLKSKSASRQFCKYFKSMFIHVEFERHEFFCCRVEVTA